MSITAFTATPTGNGAFRFAWTSDAVAPTFYFYADGELVATTTESFLLASGTAGVVYEVLDTPTPPTAAFPATMVLTWYASNDAVLYRIEKQDGADWDEVAEITADERTYYTFRTSVLDDDTTHTFRVVPVSAAGNDGTPATHTALMVRNPDVPQVSYAYNAVGGTVTISQA